MNQPGNTKGGSMTVPLTSCLNGLELAVWQLTIFVFICKTDVSKLVKQEVNGTVIFPPFSIPWINHSNQFWNHIWNFNFVNGLEDESYINFVLKTAETLGWNDIKIQNFQRKSILQTIFRIHRKISVFYRMKNLKKILCKMI